MVPLQVFKWNLKFCNYKSFNVRKCIFICDCNSFFNVGNAIAKILKNDERFILFYFIKQNILNLLKKWKLQHQLANPLWLNCYSFSYMSLCSWSSKLGDVKHYHVFALRPLLINLFIVIFCFYNTPCSNVMCEEIGTYLDWIQQQIAK